MFWLSHLILSQAVPIVDPIQTFIERTAAGGGAVSTIVMLFLAADRMGFLKRNGSGQESKVIEALDRINHQLERMSDRADDNTKEILSALKKE